MAGRADLEDGGSSPPGVLEPMVALLVGVGDETATGGLVPPEDLECVLNSSPILAMGSSASSQRACPRARIMACSTRVRCCATYSELESLLAGALVEDSAREGGGRVAA